MIEGVHFLIYSVIFLHGAGNICGYRGTVGKAGTVDCSTVEIVEFFQSVIPSKSSDYAPVNFWGIFCRIS